MLEPQARAPLLRGRLVAALALAADRVLHGVALVEDDHSVEIGAQPFDDLPDARKLFSALIGTQRSVGRKKDTFRQPDRRALPEARKRRDEQPLHAERRPIALRILDQLVGLADPDRATATLQPVVEQDAGDLPSLARAGAVAQEPAAAKANGILRIVARCRHDVKSRIDRPGAREKCRMRLAGIDDALDLGVRQNAVRDDIGWQMWSVGRLWRRDGSHGRRLHEFGRMRLRARDADRLQRVSFIKRIGDLAGIRGHPVDWLVGDFGRHEIDGRRDRRRRTLADVSADRSRR